MAQEQLVNYSNVQLNRDENIILRNVNLTVNRGDFLYIIGKVGSGKSTLMKSMYAELPVRRAAHACSIMSWPRSNADLFLSASQNRNCLPGFSVID